MKLTCMVSQVEQVLDHFVGSPGALGWAIEPVARGGQGMVFRVRRHDRQRVCQAGAEVVVKVFDPARREAAEAARDEFESLTRLNAVIDGAVIDSWKVHSPHLLFQSVNPLAAVMTVVPGRSLSALLCEEADFDQPRFDAVAPVVVAALRLYWSSEGRLYGDLHLRNILCDLAGKHISFVDPGMPERRWRCEDVSRRWYPATRDLAYLLYFTASAVKATLHKPVLRRREQWLVARMLQAALESLASAEDRKDVLDEIRACAAAHLAEMRLSCSPRGLWRLVVRRVTARYLDRVLDALEPYAAKLVDSPVGLKIEEAPA